MNKISKVYPRCIHMPTEENTVVIFSSKHGKNYQAGFTIGNQDFTVAERENEEEAKWFCDVLEMAFNKLIEPKVLNQLKSPISKKKVLKELYIKVKNLR